MTPEQSGALTALRRGFSRRCPRCGTRGMLHGFLEVRPACASCGLAYGDIRADDAPPYFTIFIVGHVVVPGALLLERWAAPPMALQMALWLPATLALTLWLLPRVKGAVIGWHWVAGIKG